MSFLPARPDFNLPVSALYDENVAGKSPRPRRKTRWGGPQLARTVASLPHADTRGACVSD